VPRLMKLSPRAAENRTSSSVPFVETTSPNDKSELPSGQRKSQPKAHAISSEPSPDRSGFTIVGVGASAGGLEAFTQLLKHLPADTGMAFVLVQHLDPHHESALANLLARATSMPVHEVTDNLGVEPNHVYVIPPNADMIIVRTVLKLTQRAQPSGVHRSIDSFLESLAQDKHDRAIGVILSGTATDGTLGLERIKGEGGITFAQDDSAKYGSMPRSAIAAGCVDFVLPPRTIAGELALIAKHPYVAGQPDTIPDRKSKAKASPRAIPVQPTGAEQNGQRRIFQLLRDRYDVDFSLYKSTTVERRINRRVVLNKQNTLAKYVTFLKGNAGELSALYSDLLISVTSFFRNPEGFEALKRHVFPKVLQRQREDPFRVWVVACSTPSNVAVNQATKSARSRMGSPGILLLGCPMTSTA